MQRLLAAGLFVCALAPAQRALAVMPDDSGIAQRRDLRPPASLVAKTGSSHSATSLIGGDGAVSYLGNGALPEPRESPADGSDYITQAVVTYFEQATGSEDLELTTVNKTENDNEEHYALIQSVNGVPVLGTYAVAHLANGNLHYARHFLISQPHVSTSPKVSTEAAMATALSDASTFSQAAAAGSTAPSLAILYSAEKPLLVWQVAVVTQSPSANYDIFVDAQSGEVNSRRRTSQDAVAGHVTANVEPACQGDAPTQVNMPNVQWARHMATLADGSFKSDEAIGQSLARLAGPFFVVQSEDGADFSMASHLQPTPAHNEVALENAPLSQTDPFYYASQARGWLRKTLSGMQSLARSRAWSWSASQMPIRVNKRGTCNAFYDGEALNFYVADPRMGCNNSGRAAKIVYHEYGHGIHDHLTAGRNTMDGQVSEGVADYVAASMTNDPNITGLIGCSKPLRGYNTVRTCENHYTYCNSKRCNAFPETGRNDGSEVHNAAPVICGALWELRKDMQARYGEQAGVTKADQFFLRFLAMVTDMQSSYTAAIAADEDDDNDPRNGTVHSCEINRAFVGAEGGTAHFPDQLRNMVPCVPGKIAPVGAAPVAPPSEDPTTFPN